jgi:hypothetical protein
MTESVSFKVSLSTRGLLNIPRSESRNDFEFVVGKRRYPCPWYVAAFVSPKLCRKDSLYGSQTEFIVETPDSNHQFEEVLSLGRGETVIFTSSNQSFFLSIAQEFENYELLFSIKDQLEPELTNSTVIPRLLERCEFNLPVNEEVKFVASHLYDFSLSSLSTLSLDLVEAIFSHPSLKIKNEDFLYELVISRMNEDSSFFKLLEFIKFEYLSSETLSNFWRIVSEHFDLLNISILSAICVRLIQDISPRTPNSRLQGKEFVPNVSTPLDGVIAHLTRKCGGNVHERGVVTVTSSELFGSGPSYMAQNAADLTGNTFFHSQDLPDQWLCYDFGHRRIKPTHYSIRSRHDGGRDDHYPRSWVIEISNDGLNWEEIDRREKDSSLNGRNLTRLFKVSKSIECRMFRIRQIGRTHNSCTNHYLVISGFELFGQLTDA